MQQECLPDLSHTSSAALHADHDHRSDTVFVLSPADKALLKEHLDEFQDADKGACMIIIERVMGQLYQLQPSNFSFDKKDASKVMSEIHRYGCRWSVSYGLENQEVVLQPLHMTQKWIPQGHS